MSEDSAEYKKAFAEEVTRLQAAHPTPEDVPTCMHMLDLVLSCNGPSACPLCTPRLSVDCSRTLSSQVVVPLWTRPNDVRAEDRRLQVLPRHEVDGVGRTARCVDRAEGAVVGDATDGGQEQRGCLVNTRVCGPL